MAGKRVTVESRSVGQSFACVGVVRDATTGRKLAECEDVRPYGYDWSAQEDARALAERRGWAVDDEGGE
jgi:hypothetical protein